MTRPCLICEESPRLPGKTHCADPWCIELTPAPRLSTYDVALSAYPQVVPLVDKTRKESKHGRCLWCLRSGGHLCNRDRYRSNQLGVDPSEVNAQNIDALKVRWDAYRETLRADRAVRIAEFRPPRRRTSEQIADVGRALRVEATRKRLGILP